MNLCPVWVEKLPKQLGWRFSFSVVAKIEQLEEANYPDYKFTNVVYYLMSQITIRILHKLDNPMVTRRMIKEDMRLLGLVSLVILCMLMFKCAVLSAELHFPGTHRATALLVSRP